MAENKDHTSISLQFGLGNRLDFHLDPERIAVLHNSPHPVEDAAEAISASLRAPIDFPSLAQAVIPDDRFVLAVEPDTPQLQLLVAAVWDLLASRGVQPHNFLVLQSCRPQPEPLDDPRSALPPPVADTVGWFVHDPSVEKSCSYLATASNGERVYLSRIVTEADVVVAAGPIRFDPLLGFRGTSSVFYPWLSDSDSVSRARGQGHRELRPTDTRPLRQMIDEIAWLLGTQFAIQVVPSTGLGFSHILSGAADSVFRRGCEILMKNCTVSAEQRVETVIVSIGSDAAGHAWPQIASAIAVARNLVVSDGRIVVLSELAELPGPGLEHIRASDDPSDARHALRAEPPSDIQVATQILNAIEWCRVYLLSELEADIVEDLSMTPLQSLDETLRLIHSSDGDFAIIENAQLVFAEVTESSVPSAD